MILPVSLTAAGAATLINIWLAIRVSQVRRSEKVLHGDAGNPALVRRMRAQGNFVENAPFFLALLVLLELSGARAEILWVAVFAFILARLAHAFGMDKGKVTAARIGGIMVTWLVLLGLAGWAIATTYMHVGDAPAAAALR